MPWSHLVSLYDHDRGKATGLAMVPKLKYELIHLTSFSKIRVDLAAQVSTSVLTYAMAKNHGYCVSLGSP